MIPATNISDPLRTLNMGRVISLRNDFTRGRMAAIQWLYHHLEGANEHLMALAELRTSHVTRMRWRACLMNVKRRGRSFDMGLAKEQASCLTETYNRIDNLGEAMHHLAMASFRGFAHLEKHRNEAGQILHLEICDQWNVVRDGHRGWWKYNPKALMVDYDDLPEANRLAPENWIIHERDGHLNWLALAMFVRSEHGERKWEDYRGAYGLPNTVIIGPEGVPPDKELEFQAGAEAVAAGASGYLPHGSRVVHPQTDGPRESNNWQEPPFREYLEYQGEKLIQAGTGGISIMIARKGNGNLAAVHMKGFRSIVRAEGVDISETLQRGIDAEVLEANFPGRPRMAFWRLFPAEDVQARMTADMVLKLSDAGFLVDPVQVSELVGFTLRWKDAPPVEPVKTEETTVQAA